MHLKKTTNESEENFAYWQSLEQKLSTLSFEEQELSFDQIVNLERSEKLDLLFKLTDDMLAKPASERKTQVTKLADIETSDKKIIQSSTLQTAVTSYIQEEFKEGVEDRHRNPEKVKFKREEEAVQVYLEEADYRKRMLAGLIDLFVSVGIGVLLLAFFVLPSHLLGKILNFERLDLLEMLPHLANGVALSLIGWVLFSSVYLFSAGQTFGCRQMDIIVVNEDGTPLNLEQCILRSVAQIFVVWTLGLSGFILLLPPFRTLHDYFAGTKVAKFYR